MPFGATQSTLTSSSGWSTDWPSHSETREGSPAISSASSETLPVAPALGCSAGLDVPLHEERQLRVALQALDAELLPEQLHPVGAVPVALDGVAAQALLVGRDVVDGDDPAQPAATEGGAGADGLTERRLVGRRDGRAPPRPRGRCPPSGGGSSCGFRSGDGPRRSWNFSPSRPESRSVVPASPPGPAAKTRWSRRMVDCDPALRGSGHRGRANGRSGASTGRIAQCCGSAGWIASADRERRWASQAAASASYAGCPISAISSVALER